MENREYGYARVSTHDQNLDRQLKALTEYGVLSEYIVTDKQSGKDTDRVGYQYLKMNLLRKGDTLVVTELDRLSRNKADIRNELECYKETGVRVKVLNIPTTLIDVDEKNEWVIDLVNTILIEVLGSMAEAERTKIKERQAEDIAAAKQRGVHSGRPRAVPPDGWFETLTLVERGQLKAVEAMELLGLKKSSYYHLRRLYPLQDKD